MRGFELGSRDRFVIRFASREKAYRVYTNN